MLPLPSIRTHLIYGLPAILMGVIALLSASSYTLFPDSVGYIQFHPFRNAGYPMFLSLISWSGWGSGAGWNGAVTLQIILNSLALVTLGYAVMRFASPWIAAFVVIAIGANPWFMQYHSFILTESLFSSLICLIVAAILLLVQRPCPRIWLLLSLTIGLSIALRPMGWAFVPLLAILLILHWQHIRDTRIKTLMCSVLPLLAVLLLESLIHHHYHPDGRPSSQAIGHLSAKVVMIDSHVPNPYPDDHPYQPIWKWIDQASKDVNDTIHRAPSFSVAHRLRVFYEFFFQGVSPKEEIRRAALKTGETIETIRTRIIRQRILSDPLAYIRFTAWTFFDMWQYTGMYTSSEAHRFNTFVEEGQPAFIEALTNNGYAAKRRMAVVTYPLFLGIGMLSLIALLQPIWNRLRHRRSRKEQTAAWILSLMIHGYFLLLALTAFSLSRYMITIWPAMVVMVIMVLLPVLRRLPVLRHLIEKIYRCSAPLS